MILAANHESLIDPWILGLATPRPIRYMAKAELWRNPVARFVLNQFGTFPVERDGGDRIAISRAAQLLAGGEALNGFMSSAEDNSVVPCAGFARGPGRNSGCGEPSALRTVQTSSFSLIG